MPSLRTIVLAVALPSALGAQTPTYTDVKGQEFVAHVHLPPGTSRFPAILLVGGSGGGIGWQDEMGQLLAQRGFVAMALAYFGKDSLPKDLERIPLEYFERALGWLSRQSYVDSTRLGIGGVSKGGELALLLASMHPELKVVAAFVPSGIVFQSIAPGYPRTSSWTYHGAELPFVAYGQIAGAKSTAELYLAGIEQADSLEAATIKVERINGPILLLSGKADNLWASSRLSEMVVARLNQKGFRHGVEHVAYPDAGHLISSIRADDVTRRGGTPEGNTNAQRDGQRRFLEFFDRQLAPAARRPLK